MVTISGDYRQCEHGYEHPGGSHACDGCLHTSVDAIEPVVFAVSARMTYTLRHKNLGWHSSPILDEMKETKHFAAVLDGRTFGVASLSPVDLSMDESSDMALIYGVSLTYKYSILKIREILLDEILRVAADRHISTLWMRTHKSQIDLWSSLGFIPEFNPNPTGLDVVLLRKLMS